MVVLFHSFLKNMKILLFIPGKLFQLAIIIEMGTWLYKKGKMKAPKYKYEA